MTGPADDPRLPRHLRGVASLRTSTSTTSSSATAPVARRLAMGLVVALVVLPFLGWVVWAGLLQADQELRWSTTGFRDITDTSVIVEFDVFLPPGSEVTCTVRALDRQRRRGRTRRGAGHERHRRHPRRLRSTGDGSPQQRLRRELPPRRLTSAPST